MGQGVLWAVCQFVSIWEPSIFFFFFFPSFLVLGGNGGLGTPLSSIAKRGAITADDDQERKREEVSPEPFFFLRCPIYSQNTRWRWVAFAVAGETGAAGDTQAANV